jgi:hypothetical protein
VVGKQAASGIAKTSLRVIGTAAVGVGILMDVLNIVDNKKALDGKKLSDQATALEDAATTRASPPTLAIEPSVRNDI